MLAPTEPSDLRRDEVRRRVFGWLPIRRSLLAALLDPEDLAIADDVIEQSIAAGSMGERPCPATGALVVVDRRRTPSQRSGSPRTLEQKAQMRSLFVGLGHA